MMNKVFEDIVCQFIDSIDFNDYKKEIEESVDVAIREYITSDEFKSAAASALFEGESGYAFGRVLDEAITDILDDKEKTNEIFKLFLKR